MRRRITRPDAAAIETPPDEAAAAQRVAEIMAERALAEGAGATGGFAVPFALDPTILPTSDGALSPLRQLARTLTVTTNEWRGVSSDGVTAAFAPEATEVGDGSPTLAQPTIRAEKAHVFVPFSIEVGQDWGGLQAELFTLFSDAKDNLEAQKFLYGGGTAANEPTGLISGAGTASVISTAATATLAPGDVYSLQESLGSRWQPRAQWVSANGVANLVYREGGGGGTVEPAMMDAARTAILGKAWHEASPMPRRRPAAERSLPTAISRRTTRSWIDWS